MYFNQFLRYQKFQILPALGGTMLKLFLALPCRQVGLKFTKILLFGADSILDAEIIPKAFGTV